MESETQTLMTPSGKSLVLKTFLTAGERRTLRNIPLRFLKVGIKKEEAPGGILKDAPNMESYDAAAAAEASEDTLLKLAIVSYDGSSEDIIKRLLDGLDEDFQMVLKAAQALTEDPTETK